MPSSSNLKAPSDIIGRDILIAEIWRILEERSLILSAERRFGKTYVIQKMEAEPLRGVLTFYQDMSDVHTAQAFTEKVCTKSRGQLRWHRRTVQEALELFSRLRGGKVTVKTPNLGHDVPEASLDLPALAGLPWQVKLTAAITELVNGQPGRVVFFWDEVPWMIGHIKEREGAETALEVLELLRVLRQDPQIKSKLRMVYTGSIGFHHVLDAPPVNDMRPQKYVPPLAPADAQEYARLRLAQEGATVTEEAETLQAIAEAADYIPYYIKNLVQTLSAAGRPIAPGDADKCIGILLTQAPESWDLPHYDTRIDAYYPLVQRRVARDLLDILAATGEVATFDALFNLLKAKRKIQDEEMVRQIVDLLRQDHYLWPDPYRFQLPLIRRFWRVHRGL
jgi:hypothetical protein